MSIGEVIHEFRKEKGMTQQEFAEQLPIDRTALAKYESGKRRPNDEVLQKAASTFDDPRLYLAVQDEATGGASSPWLNGVDLHRASVLWKSIEEIKEVIAVSGSAPISKTRDQITEADRLQIKILIMESVEAITALTHLVAVLCKEYAFSWLGVWKEHRAELKAKKYTK
ncbi:helix-turn-helix domain-containing protein [Paenibacillus alvei]|uniref:Helix-turn-helix domain-containing protein n=1 Tax=Paenibacillus alvei TaxID=44250 RepID=A0ABT4GXC0_PAEAL|nr:helix-turn-helix transcriptional regulator [Paenibacillus alvei]MCY7484290.1 helix-turn-helix domain-containing protein [Paenibacillus alvei]MCY9541817.1 helix-turn-helix domain-containing protein [Paenibacillus alvei]MCY9704995.1 helix-turn-helix domain-containing protein [Paenibacillus alvei]MCY9758854.1 helix-turn-helix domain-containing protein [Paenibacillus alvei]MCY9761203.1 helix-turn-helix domain-containing protein [Paenibacillus alvei]